jgi:hypothetical protein
MKKVLVAVIIASSDESNDSHEGDNSREGQYRAESSGRAGC